MKSTFLSILFCLSAVTSIAQYNRTIAYQQIKDLKTGALVVRLKTNDKSVLAYRQSGRNEIADRMVADRATMNRKIITAFRSFLDFCPVYFIYTKNTDDLKTGKNGIFLNDTLAIDTSIYIKENFYLLAEYGSVMANERVDEYHYKGVYTTQESSSVVGQSALVMLDTSNIQLKEPFPFYETVYLDNYNKAVEKFNRGLHKFYINSTMKQEIKKLKKG
jgi:hypothetical protein